MLEYKWSSLRSTAFPAVGSHDHIAIVPIGSTEQHGPHLPVMVDALLVTEVANRAAEILKGESPVFVLPTLWVSLAEHHMVFPGTLTLDMDTFTSVLRCLVRSLKRQGFRRILLLNGHGGNMSALTLIVDRLSAELELPLATATYWNLAAPEFGALLEKQTNLLHACEAETSMMMVLRPELVDEEAALLVDNGKAHFGDPSSGYKFRNMAEISSSGVVGFPSLANRTKGEALLHAAASALARNVKSNHWWRT